MWPQWLYLPVRRSGSVQVEWHAYALCWSAVLAEQVRGVAARGRGCEEVHGVVVQPPPHGRQRDRGLAQLLEQTVDRDRHQVVAGESDKLGADLLPEVAVQFGYHDVGRGERRLAVRRQAVVRDAPMSPPRIGFADAQGCDAPPAKDRRGVD